MYSCSKKEFLNDSIGLLQKKGSTPHVLTTEERTALLQAEETIVNMSKAPLQSNDESRGVYGTGGEGVPISELFPPSETTT